MDRQRSVEAYRNIDLMLWAALLVVFEGIILRASRSVLFIDQPFTVSLAAAITSIVYMRWGYWGGVHACLAGLVYGFLGGGTWIQLMIYAVGNLLSLAVVPLMNRIGREKLRQSQFLYLGIAYLTLFFMQTGRAIIGMAVGASFREALRFFTTDSLSAVFTLVIIWIVRRLDGVYEDQHHYLKRLHAQEKPADDPWENM